MIAFARVTGGAGPEPALGRVVGQPHAAVVGEAEVRAANSAVHLPELIASLFGGSRSEARRAISQGGVRLDGVPVADLDVPAADLDGRVLQVGKRRYRRLRVA